METSIWMLAHDTEDVSLDDWNAMHKGRTVLVTAEWTQSWHYFRTGNAVGYSASVGLVTVRAHLKESESVNISGVWKCKLGELEGRKYKTLHLRECSRKS